MGPDCRLSERRTVDCLLAFEELVSQGLVVLLAVRDAVLPVELLELSDEPTQFLERAWFPLQRRDLRREGVPVVTDPVREGVPSGLRPNRALTDCVSDLFEEVEDVRAVFASPRTTVWPARHADSDLEAAKDLVHQQPHTVWPPRDRHLGWVVVAHRLEMTPSGRPARGRALRDASCDQRGRQQQRAQQRRRLGQEHDRSDHENNVSQKHQPALPGHRRPTPASPGTRAEPDLFTDQRIEPQAIGWRIEPRREATPLTPPRTFAHVRILPVSERAAPRVDGAVAGGTFGL